MPQPKVRLVDSNGDALDNGSGQLNVIARLAGSSTFTTIAQDISTDERVTMTSLIPGDAVTDCKEIIIQADFDNTSFIMVGDGSVAGDDTEGIRLHAGDTLILPVSSTDNVSIGAAALLTGTHTGADSNTVLIDSTASFTSILIGATVNNTTDGSTGTVVSVDSTTQLTLDDLTGGSDDSWDDAANDAYTIRNYQKFNFSIIA